MSSATVAPPPRLGATHVDVWESLDHHRLLSTHQIHFMHTPHASHRWTRDVLLRLKRAGLVAMVRSRGGLGLWYLTESGADAIETIPSRSELRRKVYSDEQAAGALQQHTLGVNDVGLAFVRAARERGDEFLPLAWSHEVWHSLGAPPGRRQPDQLIADALLVYQLEEEDGTSFLYRFVELDRSTRATTDLARRLARYTRLYRRIIPAERPGDPPAPCGATSTRSSQPCWSCSPTAHATDWSAGATRSSVCAPKTLTYRTRPRSRSRCACSRTS